MSGTSLDGVDVAFVEIEVDEGARFAVSPIASGFLPYAESLIARLHAMRSGELVTIGDVCEMHSLLGWVYADAIEQVAAENGIDLASVAAVGVHGQTVWHAPLADERRRGTLQIGQPAIVAERLGVTVVSDFRSADMAAGGQGAPLVPFADFALFSSKSETRAVLNIGGIANLTYLAAGGTLGGVIGFDTGPGNLLIDGLARQLAGKSCDEGGALAAAGAPEMSVVQEFLAADYFNLPPPKSTGAELFGGDAVARLADRLRGQSIEDTLATATRITAESIARAIDRWLPARPARIIVGGGGLHNKTLMRDLAALLPGIAFDPHEAHGIPSDAKEAIAFALLACARMHDIPANVPSVTGARGQRLLGVVTEWPLRP
jgi:anhydro-N-acetylmuramic acid kinase